MFLHKIYSEPDGLFKEVQFENGINFIFARKDNNKDHKNSLNGVGKSLLLNLLDYALLSNKTPHIRSFEANNDVSKHKVVLEFFIGDDLYILKREFINPNSHIIFGKKGHVNFYDNLSLLKSFLCDLIFENKDYKGEYSNKRLRKLLPFYIKKQESSKKVKFQDPIKYISELSELEIIKYHLFLLGIDNTVFADNFRILSELKLKEPALKGVTKIVKDVYGLSDISNAQNKIDKLNIEIKSDKRNINNFQLSEKYKNIEEKSDELTSKIKELFYLNHKERNKIKAYKNSYKLGDDIQTNRIKALYEDLNELLAGNIKKTLDDAIKFRKKISKSREDFLKIEISSIEKLIETREDKIQKLEIERAKLFDFLSSKKAIKDLSEAYLDLNKKSEMVSDLEAKIKTYNDLRIDIAKNKEEYQKIYTEILSKSEDIKKELLNFKSIFFDLHNFIYPENKEKDFGLTFEPNDKKDSKIDMDVFLPKDLSYGKNKAKSLLYDLSILFNSIGEKLNGPRFMIHDGIFDGIDKAHLIKLYKYLKDKEIKGEEFQYIVTLNQEGELTDDIGDTGLLTIDKIEEESVITLRPSDTLCNKNWD